MASPPGGQYVFLPPSTGAVNVVLTPDGSNLPAPVAGAVNIEVFTSAAGSLGTGYQGSVLAPGATFSGPDPYNSGSTTPGLVLGPSLEVLSGNFSGKDVGGGGTITFGSMPVTGSGGAGGTMNLGAGSSALGAARLGRRPITIVTHSGARR